MSGIAERIKTAQNKEAMLRRALEKIIQLYTDKSHFVYELLQNAEDACATSIRFVQYPDRLEVFHDGKPFTTANLQGLCDIGKSDKIDNLNQIGEFGVGFKSVFGICDTVRLYSVPGNFRNKDIGDAEPFAVEIRDFIRPENIPEEPLEGYTTRFVFPYVVGESFSGFSTEKALKETLSKKLQNLGITTLLFMKSLTLIEYQIRIGDEPICGEYLLEKKEINDHCLLVSALGTSGGEKERTSKDEVISYLKFSRKIAKYSQRTVDIAFPVKEENGAYQCVKALNPYISVYFPTETESKLDFIVQGPYRTTPNRGSIPSDDPDNIYLAQETAALLRSSILELKSQGQLNMSFVKALPLSADRFETVGLFLPLYETVRDLFRTTAVIPTKSGKYVAAKYAKIARSEVLTTVFSDEVLSQLINDGGSYFWLPTILTETNREYKPVLEYCTGTLNISVIRPEDLRRYIGMNPRFLPAQTTEWLVKLYGLFETIPAEFSKTRSEANMTTVSIVKTSTGEFVAPFRKEGGAYIPNVFLPSPRIHSTDIHFVDDTLYSRCKHFFDNILQLQQPNEYEYTIQDIKRRYTEGLVGSDEQHVDDIKSLLKYRRFEEYTAEVDRIIKDCFAVKCRDGRMYGTYSRIILLPISTDGINNEGYLRNIKQNAVFVDADFYGLHDITPAMLISLGVRDSIVISADEQTGTYETGSRGKQPDWWTTGDFRWKLSAVAIKDVLKYMSAHPSAKDTILKSQAIMKLLFVNESRLRGTVHIGGSTVPNLENEPCELIHILRGERMGTGDGKWIVTEAGELVSPKTISKHDLSTALYGKLKPDSLVYELLRFKKTEADEVDELKKQIPPEKLDAYFESELRQRYGISTADLNERYGRSVTSASNEETTLSFPTHQVRSWDALKKHAAEMMVYAEPARYEQRIRSIRVSNNAREAKAYLSSFYRYDGINRFKFACQLCHEASSSFEATGIFLKPEAELEPLNLCLCPNCAAVYRTFRNSAEIMSNIRSAFMSKKEMEIESADYIAISIDDDDELWFTQTHFAEIQEILKLQEEIKGTKSDTPVQASEDDENEKSGLSVYSGYIGKIIRRRLGLSFAGVITNVDNEYIYVNVTEGMDKGTEKKIQLSFFLSNRTFYSISDT